MVSAAPAKFSLPDFRRQILDWFRANARDLPWRHTREPYPIWVSEIMLQQTRVGAVREHYTRFMERFPSIVSLALAPEDEVLAAWSGLGYYRRARLLHGAARFIVREHQGCLPRTADELHKLPGIGDYTAAAIASIAFDEPVAVVDGNVQRVIQRLFALSEAADSPSDSESPSIREYAQALLARRRPGDFNQAMMELGATVCLPKKPLCLSCPVERHCSTRGEHAVEPRPPMRSRQIAYALVCRVCRGAAAAQEVMLERRLESASQMPGMWQLPEVDLLPDDEKRVELTLRHAITVTNYYVRVVRLSERESRRRLPARDPQRHWIKTSELGEMPLTGLARKVLQRLQVMRVLDFLPSQEG